MPLYFRELASKLAEMETEFEGYLVDSPAVKPTFADYLRQSFLPGLSLFAFILVEWKGGPPWQKRTLLALTVFLVVWDFLYPQGRSWYVRWITLRKDRTAAIAALPKLRILAESFTEFVDQSTGGTLHYIVWNELCQGNPITAAKITLPEVDLWGGWCLLFRKRIGRDVRSGREFLSQMMDFHFFISKYNTLCVAAIFTLLPADMKDRVTGAPKSSLNSFQQRFTLFLRDYQEFAKTVAASRPAFRSVPHIFVFPKPLP
jgi:hypothetical protein